jgi:hypothetical protein
MFLEVYSKGKIREMYTPPSLCADVNDQTEDEKSM